MADVKVWQRKDGTKVPLDQMSEKYIQNCLQLLEGNQKKGSKIYKYLKEESDSRKPKQVPVKKKFKYIADGDSK